MQACGAEESEPAQTELTLEQLREHWAAKEEQFRNDLAQRQLTIEEMDSDGNCLFRAVAF